MSILFCWIFNMGPAVWNARWFAMSVRVVIIGAGSSGEVLARRLAARHEVIVIENAESELSRLRSSWTRGASTTKITYPLPRLIAGDGTSRLLLSKHIDIHGQTALVALTGDDEVNLELGSLGHDLGFDPVIAMLHDPNNRERYEQKDILVLDRSNIVADQVDRTLCFKGQVTPRGIGLGRGEIVEIRLTAASPLLKKPLRHLAPDSWRIAAVFRADNLLVPTGDTILEEEDRVLLVGQPQALISVARYLRVGEAQFPKQYGNNLTTIEFSRKDAKVSVEARSVAGACEITRLLRCIPEGVANTSKTMADDGIMEEIVSMPLVPEREFNKAVATQHPGVVLVPPVSRPWSRRLTGRRSPLSNLCDALVAPVAVCRGSNPYRRILLPVSSSQIAIESAELAIDITRRLGGTLTVATVSVSEIVAGEKNEMEDMDANAVRRLCALYELPFEYKKLEGNPVRAIAQEAAQHDLVVVARRHRRRDTFWNPDVACRIADLAPCTAIIVTVSSES